MHAVRVKAIAMSLGGLGIAFGGGCENCGNGGRHAPAQVAAPRTRDPTVEELCRHVERLVGMNDIGAPEALVQAS
jgi:hypothetical protein